MTKRFTAFAAVVLLLLTTACKKENDSSPTYNPVGFWRGSVQVRHGGLLLKPGGEAAVYFSIYGNDTAAAVKGYGRYTVSGNAIKAWGALPNTDDTIFYQTNLDSENLMTGFLYASWTGEAPQLVYKRQ
jgi:hypothetical protein